MKLRYPKTREEFNELAAYLNYKPLHLNDKKLTGTTPERNTKPFRKWPPEVQAQAKINLANLLVKHKDKLDAKPYGSARNGYYALLVATAAMMATRQLGVAKWTWKDCGKATQKRILNKSKVRTYLGLQEPLNKIGGYGTSRKNHSQKYNPMPEPNQVNQGDLTGV
jgi:hypothetical protein